MTVIHLQRLGGVELDQGLLNQAIAFFTAGSRAIADVRVTPTVTLSPMAPAVVCYAFSAELYLKLLHVIATGQPKRGHKLDELFQSLPEDTRSELASNYTGDLGTELTAMSQAFVEWRYEHEHEQLSINPQALANVGVACHRVVRRLKPDLKVFGENRTAG